MGVFQSSQAPYITHPGRRLFSIFCKTFIWYHYFWRSLFSIFVSLRTVFVIEVPKQCQISYSDTSEESPGDQLSGNQTHFERKLSLKAPQWKELGVPLRHTKIRLFRAPSPTGGGNKHLILYTSVLSDSIAKTGKNNQFTVVSNSVIPA